jgi:hypothetical protein
MSALAYMELEPGDAAPLFSQNSPGGVFNLGNLGGAFLAVALVPSSSVGVGKAVLEIVGRQRAIFDGVQASLLVVTVDRHDASRLKDTPGFQALLDFDGKVARRYGAIPMEVPPGTANVQYRPRFVLLDRRLRVVANLELSPDGSDAARILPEIEGLPARIAAEPELDPPILIVPRVFPADFCRHLIGLFEANGGEETGVISQTGEKTETILRRDIKRRRDYGIEDAALIERIKTMLKRHLVPEIARAFQFQVSHVERHIVSRYAASERGHFRPHRDNHAMGTAHRRFAATINLNSDFEGGALSFPEFGTRQFKAPEGGAIVFSCSLMHAVSEMTRGLRYAYLPFFYDEAAAKLLEANRISWSHDDQAPAAADASRL